MKSIIQSEESDKRYCYLCEALEGQTNRSYLERHHIFGGANRKLSEHYGLVVYLCKYHHNAPPVGAHFNAKTMDFLHQIGQKAFETRYGTRTRFMEIFGRNYLPESADYEDEDPFEIRPIEPAITFLETDDENI